MKRQIITLGLMLAATFALTNCTKEMPQEQTNELTGTPFAITASVIDTKTTNAGIQTEWKAGDAINLFHAVNGTTTYTSDGSFTITSDNLEAGKFTGTLTSTLDETKGYDWYAFYPYSNYVTTPANTSSGYMTVASSSNGVQTQTGNNSMAHIAGSNYPMAGKVFNVSAGTTPNIQMSHLCCLIEVNVTNTTDKDLTVTDIVFNAPDYITGTYYIDFTGDTPKFKDSGTNYVAKTATLKVKNGTAIAKDASAKFYLAVKPFDAAANSKLSLTVNGYKKEITLTETESFTAGKIKTLNFNYNNTAEAEMIKLPWYEDFTSNDLSKYIIKSYSSSTTQLFDENLAGGKAPELMIANSNGSLTASFDLEGYVGTLTLVFLTNNDSRINVTTTTEGVTIKKDEAQEYLITIPEGGVEALELTILNPNSDSNVRIDEIRLVKGLIANQTLSFATAKYTYELGSEEATAFKGQTVTGAYTTVTYTSSNTKVAAVNPTTGEVTLGETSGDAIITATAVATNEYKSATASYEITTTKPVSGDLTEGASWTYTFTKQQWSSNGAKTLNGLSWTLSGDGGYWGWDSNNGRGHQFGSGSKPYKTMKLSTSSYTGGVKTIKVNTSGASKIAGKLTVTVNGKQYGSTVSLTSSAKEYTFDMPADGMQAGEISLSYTQTSAKAIYIKSISIN